MSDLVPIADQTSLDPTTLPASEILRREVYTKKTPHGLAVRKLVAWKTNKHAINPAYPNFVVFFTDYAPGRNQPLKTDLRVAASEETMHTYADDWLAVNIKRGWTLEMSNGKCQIANDERQEDTPAITKSLRSFDIRHSPFENILRPLKLADFPHHSAAAGRDGQAGFVGDHQG